MGNIKLSVICCFNDDMQFREFEEQIKAQDLLVHLIPIDNINSRFSSCAKAFNSVIDEINTEYVLFSHQDIRFSNNHQLSTLLSYMERINVGDMIGVAGCRYKKQIISALGNDDHNNNLSQEMIICDSLDECFWGGHTSFFVENRFDEDLCNGWHLYAVDQCLHTRLLGNRVYVCNVPIIHLSKGNPDYRYNTTFYRLCKKYNNLIPYISTTCGNSYPFFAARLATMLYRNLRRFLGMLK